MKKPYCIIPARANSKGLKNKNVLFFGNKPLILHTVDQAIESGLFDLEDIIVSSDSEEYLRICDTRGVTTLKRPDELATDKSSSYDVLEHLFKSLDNSRPFVLLQVTSPLRTAKNIQEAYQLFKKCDYQTVVSMKDVGVDLRITTRLDENNKIIDAKMLDKGIRRQDSDIYYRPNGAIYIDVISNYLKTGSFLTPITTAYIMGENNSLDIDDRDDFVLASIYSDTITKQSQPKFNQDQFVSMVMNTPEKQLFISDSRLKKITLNDYGTIIAKHITLKNIFNNIDLFNKIDTLLIAVSLSEIYHFNQFKNYFTKIANYCSQHNKKLKILLPIPVSFTITFDINEVKQLIQLTKQLCEKHAIQYIDISKNLMAHDYLDFIYSIDGVQFNDKAFKKIQKELNQVVK